MEPAEYQPFAPEIHDYVDGRLSAEAERAFELRMSGNPSLKAQVESLRKALDVLHNLPAMEPRPGFDERVIGRIREEDLAERARKQIAGAPVPIWQHVVQVGIGAAAAALVFAMVGFPGLFGADSDADRTSGTGGEGTAGVMATEDDLLPALADQLARFESLRRNVAHLPADDANLQRELMALELRQSDLMRRNAWLAGEVADLPPARRATYAGFIDDLDDALRALDSEISQSLSERRPVNTASVNGALAGVRTPDGRVRHYRLNARVAESDVAPAAVEDAGRNTLEVTLYSAIRRADYHHDHHAVIAAADAYLVPFATGRFKDHANAAAIAAHLRLSQPVAAAQRFAVQFGEYDEDVSPAQHALIKGLLSEAEFELLNLARVALRE